LKKLKVEKLEQYRVIFIKCE